MNLQDYQREEQRITQALDALKKQRGENPEKSMEETFLEQQLMELKTPVLAESRKMSEATKIQENEENRKYNAPVEVGNRSAWQSFKPEVQQYARQIFPSLKDIEPQQKAEVAKVEEIEPEEKQVELDVVAREPATQSSEAQSNRLNLFIPGLMQREGGFRAKVKGDQDTNKGVTLETYRQFKKDQSLTKDDLKNISDEDVKNITKRYYDEVGGDKVKDPRVSAILLDQNYNKGSRFLYQVQDLFGHNRSSKLEKETIDAINSQDPEEFSNLLLQKGSQDYANIVSSNPAKRREYEGWLNRLDNLRKEVGLTPTEYESLKRPEPSQQPKFQPTDIEALIKDMSDREKQASLFKQMAKVRDAAAGFGLGRQVATDYGMYDELSKQAQIPLRNLQLKQELENDQAKNDPNSDISQLAKKSLEELGMDTSAMSRVSYAQLEKLYPALTQALYTKIASEAKYASARVEDLARKDTKARESKDKKFNDLNRRVEKVFANKDIVKAYQDTSKTQKLIDNALRNWKSLGDDYKASAQAAFVAYAKQAQGDESVLRKDDIKVLAGGTDYGNLGELITKYSAKVVGSDFSLQELREFAAVIRTIRDIKKKEFQGRLNPILKTAQDSEIDVSYLIDPELIKDVYSPTIEEKEARLKELQQKEKAQKK
jgi:hypothetical protein